MGHRLSNERTVGVDTCFGGRPICDLCSLTIAITALLLLQVLHSIKRLLVVCCNEVSAATGRQWLATLSTTEGPCPSRLRGGGVGGGLVWWAVGRGFE